MMKFGSRRWAWTESAGIFSLSNVCCIKFEKDRKAFSSLHQHDRGWSR